MIIISYSKPTSINHLYSLGTEWNNLVNLAKTNSLLIDNSWLSKEIGT